MEVDPAKTSCVNNWPVPTDQERLRQFLGFASYYRKFIKNFAQIAGPLHVLTEKTKTWQWSTQCEAAFNSLKEKLLSPPILSFPQFDKTFILDTDASQEGVGAVLSHEGQEQVVAYASRVLSKAERQYCATRWEMLAVVWAIKNFRPYLWGRRFVVRTDHSSLRWLQSFKDPEGQVARWLEILSEYNFTVLHQSGRKHSNADALSRMPCKQCGLQDSAVEATTSTTLKSPAQVSSTWIPVLPSADQKQEQQSDPDIQQVTNGCCIKLFLFNFPVMAVIGYRHCGHRAAIFWLMAGFSTGNGKTFWGREKTDTYNLCFRKHWSSRFCRNSTMLQVVATLESKRH